MMQLYSVLFMQYLCQNIMQINDSIFLFISMVPEIHDGTWHMFTAITTTLQAAFYYSNELQAGHP